MIYSQNSKNALAQLLSDVNSVKTAELVTTTTDKFSKETVFTYQYTHPIVLDLLMIKKFGQEWLSWVSDTIISEIKSTFGSDISAVNFSKLLSARTIHVVDTYWEEWEIFEKITNGLNGIKPETNIMQGLDTAALVNGVEIANTLRKETFNEEVSRFVAGCLLHDDVHYAIPPLEFAQQYIPFSYEKEKTRYEELQKQPNPYIHETAEDIQAAKLIIASDYRSLKHRELKEQLNVLHEIIK